MKFTFACKKISSTTPSRNTPKRRSASWISGFRGGRRLCDLCRGEENRCVVELTIRSSNGTLFRAQTEDPDGDMRSAIDEAVSFIDRRIRKNKTRLAKTCGPTRWSPRARRV